MNLPHPTPTPLGGTSPGASATTILDKSDPRFRAELPDVGTVSNVSRTALGEGVGRIVVASFNRAADFDERLIRTGTGTGSHCHAGHTAALRQLPRLGQAVMELLGVPFATGQGLPGRLEVVRVRIAQAASGG